MHRLTSRPPHCNAWCKCMNAHPIRTEIPGYTVRRAVEVDVEDCNRVCRLVHGHDCGGEVLEATTQGTAMVVEHAGRMGGYTRCSLSSAMPSVRALKASRR